MWNLSCQIGCLQAAVRSKQSTTQAGFWFQPRWSGNETIASVQTKASVRKSIDFHYRLFFDPDRWLCNLRLQELFFRLPYRHRSNSDLFNTYNISNSFNIFGCWYVCEISEADEDFKFQLIFATIGLNTCLIQNKTLKFKKWKSNSI